MATIKEIAKLAGVSPMTVSNVINKKYNKVSAQTIDKVQKVIEDLNYIPNMSARSLVSKNSQIIVLIIPQTLADDPDKDYAMHNPFYGEIINSIEYNLRKKNYYMMLRFVSESEIYYPLLKLWNADGVIVLGTDQKQFDLNLKNLDIPFVMIDSYVNGLEKYNTVASDDRDGGKLVADYLVERGCNDFGLVCTDISVKGVSQERYTGFIEGLKANNKTIKKANVFQGYPSYEYGLKIAEDIAKTDIDGVFALSDMMAIGIIEGLKKSGKSIPKDVSVVGFDGLFVSEFSNPKLTTVKQNIYEKGENAVDLILRSIENNGYKENIVLPVELLKKESVR